MDCWRYSFSFFLLHFVDVHVIVIGCRLECYLHTRLPQLHVYMQTLGLHSLEYRRAFCGL